jgi:hypothetical protein
MSAAPVAESIKASIPILLNITVASFLGSFYLPDPKDVIGKARF